LKHGDTASSGLISPSFNMGKGRIAMSLSTVMHDKISLPRTAKILDLSERIILVLFFGHFAYQVLQQYAESLRAIVGLQFAAECFLLVLILIRRPSATLSRDPLDWLFGLAGSLAPLLTVPNSLDPVIPPPMCFAMIVLGIFVQVSAKVILGLSFGVVAANRGVKVLGPYRLIRHPMYAGYTLTHIGLWLAMPSLRNAIFYSCALALQIIRIHREERVLTLDPAYRNFAARVRYRLLPGVF
jgi:protein-S-isoprenylcysteine O-methyltransferase Ste14